MFTGIIESLGQVVGLQIVGSNLVIQIRVHLDEEPIKIDQSIAHNGICLTVTEIIRNDDEVREYLVLAVQETLEKTSLDSLRVGHQVNIERSLKVTQRLDGHFVQGHVDTVGEVTSLEERDGSWMYRFSFPERFAPLIVDKGSVTINGVSLTVIAPSKNNFSVTIIPYTYEHTNFHNLKEGDQVNLEFDIIGKYITRMQRI